MSGKLINIKLPAKIKEKSASTAIKLTGIKIVGWVIILTILALELISSRDHIEGRGFFGMTLISIWVPFGEIMLDAYIIANAIKGLGSKNKSQATASLILIPVILLVVFLIFRVISLATGWE